MNESIERPLKELFAAVYHDHQKENTTEIRADQENVLNELLNQPSDFKNKVILKRDGLEVHTLHESITYIHSKSLETRVIRRKAKEIQ